jgi:hypothetical protein
VLNQVIKLRVDRASSAADVGTSPYLPIIASINREGLQSPHPQASLLSYDKFVQSLRIGSLLKWKVHEITTTEIKVVPDIEGANDGNYVGVIPLSLMVVNNDMDDHLSAALKEIQKVDTKNPIHKLHPFHGVVKGASIQCKVMQIRKQATSNDVIVYLSHDKRSSASDAAAFTTRLLQWQGANNLKLNRVYMGFITEKNRCVCAGAAVALHHHETSLYRSKSRHQSHLAVQAVLIRWPEAGGWCDRLDEQRQQASMPH